MAAQLGFARRAGIDASDDLTPIERNMEKMRRIAALLIASMALVAMVSAYSRAEVVNAANLKVVNTSEALIALTPGTDLDNSADHTASIESNVMTFVFGKGLGGTNWGLQPGSSYAWDKLFYITNHSAGRIQVSIDVDYGGNTDLHRLINDIKAGGEGWNGTNVRDYPNFLVMEPGQTVPVHLGISIPSDESLKNLNGTIRVYANPHS